MPDNADVVVDNFEVPAASGLSCETVLFDAAWTEDGAIAAGKASWSRGLVGRSGLFPGVRP